MGGRSGSGLCLDGYLFGGGLEQVLNSYCISLNCMHPKLPFVEHFKTCVILGLYHFVVKQP